MTQEDRLVLIGDGEVLRARAHLQRYCISNAHYRYHKCVSGVAYTIPMNDVDESVTKDILILLKSRTCLMGIKGDNYVIYQNADRDIVSFSDDLSHSDPGLMKMVRDMWNRYFNSDKKFYITFSLDRYFSEEGIADVLDLIMESDDRLVLSMMYGNNLTIMVRR